MENLPESHKSSTSKEASIALLGFTLFDFTHIAVATFTLIMSYVTRPIMELEAGSSFVELSLSLLLILFVVSMVKHHYDPTRLRRNLNFCCLVASLSMFIPNSFMLPDIVGGSWASKEESTILLMEGFSLIFSFLAVIFFALAMLVEEQGRKAVRWRWFMFIGNLLFLMQVPFSIAVLALGQEFSPWVLSIMGLSKAAPVFPAALMIWQLTRKAVDTPLY